MPRKREVNHLEGKLETESTATVTKKRKISKQSNNLQVEDEQRNISKNQKGLPEVDLSLWRISEIVGGDVYYIPNVSLIIESHARSRARSSPFCVVCIRINSR